MKQSRFTEEQMVAILREADRSPVTEVAKKHKLSEQAIIRMAQAFRRTAARRHQAFARAGSREFEA